MATNEAARLLVHKRRAMSDVMLKGAGGGGGGHFPHVVGRGVHQVFPHGMVYKQTQLIYVSPKALTITKVIMIQESHHLQKVNHNISILC